jgi:hypothetical protein
MFLKNKKVNEHLRLKCYNKSMDFNDDPKPEKETPTFLAHYYGDIVRKLFMAGAVVMIFILPFFSDQLFMPLFVALFFIILMGILAGLTNPFQIRLSAADMIISMIALFSFEYNAVSTYKTYSTDTMLFWTEQILALIFLFALYYATKTLRAMILAKKEDK